MRQQEDPRLLRAAEWRHVPERHKDLPHDSSNQELTGKLQRMEQKQIGTSGLKACLAQSSQLTSLSVHFIATPRTKANEGASGRPEVFSWPQNMVCFVDKSPRRLQWCDQEKSPQHGSCALFYFQGFHSFDAQWVCNSWGGGNL